MFEILQHTADVRLRVVSPAIEDLFRDAMKGMFAIMGRDSRWGTRDSVASVRIVVDSVDRTSLLVDFLNAVLSRAHIEHVSFEDVTFERLTETDVDARVAGGPARFEHDIKAVTYHEADVRQTGSGWETMLVFDI